MSSHHSSLELEGKWREAANLPLRSELSSYTWVRHLSERCEIDGLREIWNKLGRHPNADLDQYLNVLEALGGDVKPLVLVLYRRNWPESILIGRQERGRQGLRIGYRDIFGIQTRKLVFIYNGLLGNGSLENCLLLLDSLRGCLRSGNIGMAFFNSIPVDSPFYRAATEFQGQLTRDHAPDFEIHRSMKLPADVNAVYERLSPKVRKNLKWQQRKLVSDFPGAVSIRCFRLPEEIDQLFRDAEQIAGKTYQRGLGVGFADNPVLRRRLGAEAERGWLRAYVLYVAQSPCAFWIGKLHRQTFYSDFMGYDPHYSKYSPGMYVIMKVVEDFCESKDGDTVHEIDFGLGDAQYKTILGNSAWQEASVCLFAPTLRGFSLNLLHTTGATINKAAKTVLAKADLLAKVKRIWRNSAMRPAESTR